MKKWGLLALLLMGTQAFASSSRTYDLQMNLSLNGKHLSSPNIIAHEGQTASITQENSSGAHFIEVIATESTTQKHPGILMKFTVGTIGKNGERTILATPQIIAKKGQLAQISEKSSSGPLSLSVTAKTHL